MNIINYAPAIKETVSGGTTVCKNVSPLKHNLDVKVKSKNLIPFPYLQSTKELNGITVIANDNGTVSVSGTATADTTIYFDLCEKDFGITNMYSGFVYNNGYAVKDCTYDAGNKKTYISISVKNGEEINNTYYPQIELGSTATSYTPYKTEFEGVEVSRLGKNLFNINNIVQYPSRNDYANHPVRRVEDLLTFEGEKGRFNSNLLPLPKGKIIYVSGEVTGNDTFNMNVVRTSADGTSFDNLPPYHYNITGEFIYKFTIPNDEYKYGLNIYSSHAYNSSNGMKNFQISFFSDGVYEPYKEPQTATANIDGTVEGLTSVSPNMTLLADNSVIIDCTYNKSTKAYIDEKVSALSAALLEV